MGGQGGYQDYVPASLPSCVALGEVLKISLPQFPQLDDDQR